jgi:REP element-mobilizing transposase RayT
VTKYRHKVLTGDIETFVKGRLQEICDSYGWELIEKGVRPRHLWLGI